VAELDFITPDPLVTFTTDQIAFVYGSKFKQRYFKKVGDDFAPFPATWDVTHRQWWPYGVSGATSGLCDGCHSVNYDIERKTVTEWNVGCERCHGPGSDHVTRPLATNIVNPARLATVAAVDVCVQCHSQGYPHAPIGGREFRWPVGFRVGLRLADFWKLDDHTIGAQDTLHFADGSGRESRMQGNDFVQSLMYTRGVSCASCHDPHGTPNNADLIKPARTMCLTCVSCHMPKIAWMLGDVMVRSHTFKFIVPADAERLKMPDACTTCHTDKTPAWATAALRTWTEFSPWRVGH
jgi:predicted CXXCH cytochrome family protein